MQCFSTKRWFGKIENFHTTPSKLAKYNNEIWNFSINNKTEELYRRKKFEKINFNPFSTKDALLKEDIDPDAKLFNDTKVQKIRFLLLFCSCTNTVFHKFLEGLLFYFSPEC